MRQITQINQRAVLRVLKRYMYGFVGSYDLYSWGSRSLRIDISLPPDVLKKKVLRTLAHFRVDQQSPRRYFSDDPKTVFQFEVIIF